MRRTLKVAFLTLFVLGLIEQIRFYLKKKYLKGKGVLAGPSYALPLFGEIFNIVSNPEKFWNDQRSFGDLSWNSIVGQFTVMSTNLSIVRKAFMLNGEDSLLLALHPNAKIILGPENISFQHGPSHKSVRASFLPLFTRNALASYIPAQSKLIREYLGEWVKQCEGDKYVEMWPNVRTLNALTSQRVFLGDHVVDPEGFSNSFIDLTRGFLSLPIYFPGTGLWKAVRGRENIMRMLEIAVQKSKEAMSQGKEADCLLDYWSKHMLNAIKVNEENNLPPPEHSSNGEMSHTLIDFLFAAQDASTASLDWTFALMADYPEILAKVREEQQALRPNSEPVTYEALDKMVYTRAVVLEMLRFKPPAPMMPFAAQKDIELTDDYVLPKGALLCADIWQPTIEGFPNGYTFDPDRMLPPRREDAKYRDAFMTFGCGPHVCVGQGYAINHLVTFLAEVSTLCEWTRKRTEKSEHIQYLPTICPGDCLINLKYRKIAV